MNLQAYQVRLLELAQRTEALQFGRFTLKSGRVAPYFFNTGRIASGRELDELGRCYADWLAQSPVPFDGLFGPAYKGIPIAVTAAAALAREHGRDVGVTFNRKEAKTHGDGGLFVGSSLSARMMMVDDVITDGAAKLEAAELIKVGGGGLAGVLVALDRQERGAQSARSSVADVSAKLGVPVYSLVTLSDLLTWLEQQNRAADLAAVRAYRDEYGARDEV